VLLSVPISYHFHGCTALLVALVVVSGAILNTHTHRYHTLDTTRRGLSNKEKTKCLASPFKNYGGGP